MRCRITAQIKRQVEKKRAQREVRKGRRETTSIS
jgi:hypothetical protein